MRRPRRWIDPDPPELNAEIVSTRFAWIPDIRPPSWLPFLKWNATFQAADCRSCETPA
jgi:hypothetical protein